MQILRDAVWQSKLPNETLYQSGDHIICISNRLPVTVTPSVTGGVSNPETGETAEGSARFGLSGCIGRGGISLFPQLPSSTPGLNLGYIRPLTDALLEHGCGTCGSVPIHLVDQGNNSPDPGILTFNYVSNPSCTGQCIGSDGNASNPTATGNTTATSAKFRGRI